MPPKKDAKKAGNSAKDKVDDSLPPGYDPETMQKFLKPHELFQNSCESEVASLEIFELFMDGVYLHLVDKKLEDMVAPYIAEDGLSISMEPSLMFNYTQDDKKFYIDTEQE